jgi:hypothetical protein
MVKIANIDSILNGAQKMGWDNAYVEEQIFSSLDGNISPSEYETEIYDKCLNFRELSHDNMNNIVYLNDYSEYYGDYYEDNQLVSLSDVEFETSIINLDIPIRYKVNGNSFVAENSFKFSFYKPGSDMSEEDPMVIVYSPNENLYSSTVTINKPVKINIPRALRYEHVDGFKIDYVGQRKLCSCNVSFVDGDAGTDDVEIADTNHETFYFYYATYEDTIANTNGIYIDALANKNCGSNPDGEKIYTRTINVDFTNSMDEPIAYYVEYSFNGSTYNILDGSPVIVPQQTSQNDSYLIQSKDQEHQKFNTQNLWVRIATTDTVSFDNNGYAKFSKLSASSTPGVKTDTTCTFNMKYKWTQSNGDLNIKDVTVYDNQ